MQNRIVNCKDALSVITTCILHTTNINIFKRNCSIYFVIKYQKKEICSLNYKSSSSTLPCFFIESLINYQLMISKLILKKYSFNYHFHKKFSFMKYENVFSFSCMMRKNILSFKYRPKSKLKRTKFKLGI